MRFFSDRLTLLSVLTFLLLLSFGGVASAEDSGWQDAPADWWASSYKDVTAAEVRAVADGFDDGMFGPALPIKRGQFTKMATNGLGLSLVDRDTPTFIDVLKSHIFYPYIEGAYEVGLIEGWGSGDIREFRPDITISRQQANSILGRYLSEAELEAGGFILGSLEQYDSLLEWYAAEGRYYYLDGFIDEAAVADSHRAATAYLVYRGIVKGSGGKLSPTATLNRAQAAVMVVRVAKKATDITSLPNVPAGVQVDPASPSNNRTPLVRGLAAPGMNVVLFDTYEDVTTAITTVKANAAGRFYLDIPPGKDLQDGTHSFTCKTQNAQGIFSESSVPVEYVVDTVAPTGSVVSPELPEGASEVTVNVAKPVFRVRATDDRSGVASVDFQVYSQVSRDTAETVWRSVSVAEIPDEGDDLFTAVWPAEGVFEDGLTDGSYQFRAVITDKAGNEYVTHCVTVVVDTVDDTEETSEQLDSRTGGGIVFGLNVEDYREAVLTLKSV